MDGLDSGGGFGGGGMGGGSGGMNMGDLMNNPQMMAMAQAMQSDPEIMAAMSNPEIMAKLQQIQSNPAAAMQLMQDPQLAPIIMKLQRLMGGGGMGMGSGFGGASSTSSSTSSSSSGNIIQITNGVKQLNELIEQSKKFKKLLAIDYYTTWCGPCKMISPVFNELSSTYNEQCIFAKVDGDTQLDLVKDQGIRAYPTFHFYYDGKRVEEFSGANTEQLRSIVAQYAEKSQTNMLQVSPYKHFPLRDNEIVTYTTIKWDVVQQKIHELNNTVKTVAVTHPHYESAVLNPTDEGQIDTIIAKLQDRSKYHVSEFTTNQYHVVDHKLLQWPNEHMSMPLHLLRMLVLHPHAAAHYTKQESHILIKDGIQMIDSINVALMSAVQLSDSKIRKVSTMSVKANGTTTATPSTSPIPSSSPPPPSNVNMTEYSADEMRSAIKRAMNTRDIDTLRNLLTITRMRQLPIYPVLLQDAEYMVKQSYWPTNATANTNTVGSLVNR